MALLLLCPTKDPEPWRAAISSLDPRIDIRIWPEIGDPDEILFALLWNHPPGALNTFKNLKAISSLGAGIDHINNDPEIPHDLPVARIVDPTLVQSMSEYVVTAALQHFRDLRTYQQHQSDLLWQDLPPKQINDCQVGIMGMGILGYDAAKKLHVMGFRVNGWSRQQKHYPELTQSFAGLEALPSFLNCTDILVCLLPLTSTTEGILNWNLFSQLPSHAYLINVARGAHLNEIDLLAALDTQKLSGACLDVFNKEPLPVEHPFWLHPKITITPHIASITNPSSAAAQVVDNYHRAASWRPLLHAVDLARGY